MESNFRAGGLASGLDTNLIIDQLTEIQRNPISLLERKKQGFQIQLSGIGALVSNLGSLESATRSLADNGVRGVSAGTVAGATVTASSEALAGTYSLRVDNLAQAAKARGNGFASANAPVTGGSVQFGIDGETYDIAIADGAELTEVAFAINQSDAPVNATLISDGTQTYLSITRTETGHAIGSDPSTALTITETSTGSLGQPLGLVITQSAENAQFNVDGLDIERRSNTVTDAIQGASLTLTQETATASDLVLNVDLESTTENIQAFVAAFNSIVEQTQGDFSGGESSDRTRNLAGDPAVRMLQSRLQSLLTVEVAAAGTSVRTLADMGLKTTREGMLSIDEGALQDALTRDPSAVDAIFAATGGVADQVQTLVDLQTDLSEGILTQRTEGLNDSIENIDLEIANLELRVEAFRDNLIARFTAMETLLSGLQSSGNFLSQVKFPGFSTDS